MSIKITFLCQMARWLPFPVKKRVKQTLIGAASIVNPKPPDPEPVDLRDLLTDPFEAFSRVDSRQPVLLNVPLERCRTFGLLGFPPTVRSSHPYVLTMLEYLAGNIREYEHSPLKYYYENVQAKTAADLVDISDRTASRLHRMEAMELDFPWLAVPGLHVKSMRFRFLEKEGAQFGKQLTGEDGWNFIGPVSSAKAELEMERVFQIIDSIKRFGYNVPSRKEHILGYLLKDGDSYAALTWGGQHRLPALAALGFTHVSLLFYQHRVVDRASVKSWPAVTSGDFTPEQALHVFDQVFKGRQARKVSEVWPQCLKLKPRTA